MLLSHILANYVLKFPNFRCHGNEGRSGVNFSDIVKLPNLDNIIPSLVQHFDSMSYSSILCDTLQYWSRTPCDMTDSKYWCFCVLQNGNTNMIAEHAFWRFFIMSSSRHLGFGPIGNGAVRSAVPQNPTLEPNMTGIVRPVAELWPFEIFVKALRSDSSWSLVSRQ